MKKIVLSTLIAVIFSISAYAMEKPVLLPLPSSVQWSKGEYTLPKQLKWHTNVTDKQQLAALTDAVDVLVDENATMESAVATKRGNAQLLLTIVKDAKNLSNAESYTLSVTTKKIEIKALNAAGIYRGIQTLRQLTAVGPTIETVAIADSPKYADRGMMLDVSRHFFSKEFIKKQIRQIAALKMNRLHLHLTDAAGWRLEIKKYPRLTQVAAWRKGATWKEWWTKNGAKYSEEGDPNAYGGYYTQDDMRELVAYAKKHFVTLVPEVEMPAHSEETLVAYPELSCTGKPYENADFCAGNEKVYEFWKDVLTEVVAIFPGTEIHIGGDEASKRTWHTCPLCQAKMKEHNLADVDALQTYFAERINTIASELGTTIVGWDDLMSGGAPKGSTVQVWGDISNAQKAVAQGHQVIISAGSHLYLDKYQDNPLSQPEAIGGYLPLEGVYSLGEMLDTLQFANPALVRGVEACLWTEYVPTESRVEEMLWPRLFALCEVGWGTRSDAEQFRSRAHHYSKLIADNGYTPFNLDKEIGQRPEYKTKVNALSVGKPVKYNLPYNKSYVAGGDAALTDGLCGGWTYFDKRWQGFIGKNRVDVVVDLQRTEDIHCVKVDFLQVAGADVYTPATFEVQISDNGTDFRTIGKYTWVVDKSIPFGIENGIWIGNEKARYVRVLANVNPEIGGWIFTDEVIVN